MLLARASGFIRSKGSHFQLAIVEGIELLFLDVSFRDDVRRFVSWDGRIFMDVDVVQTWAAKRLSARGSAQGHDWQVQIALHSNRGPAALESKLHGTLLP